MTQALPLLPTHNKNSEKRLIENIDYLVVAHAVTTFVTTWLFFYCEKIIIVQEIEESKSNQMIYHSKVGGNHNYLQYKVYCNEYYYRRSYIID